ncbi:T9SS type A sorting domain-containing protein, partial [Candidatus Poribacteria bacterium]|nr:T9SS type A sorting domain-containing protein [Candidatus Poribacteria bacterium]
VFPKSPKFLVTIEDDYALDVPKISISLSYQGEEPKFLKKNEYIMTTSENLKKVTISYPSDLLNGEYFIQAKALDTSGNIGYLGHTESEPLRFRIDQKVEIRDIMNYPNPFSEKTLFTYWLTQPAEKIVIKIYTLRGRLIKTIQQDMPHWKYNEEIWDGRDEEGKKLSSGVYLYKLTMFDGNRKVEKVDRLAIVR